MMIFPSGILDVSFGVEKWIGENKRCEGKNKDKDVWTLIMGLRIYNL